MDKAGAYGIQGLGGQLVEHYQGRFDTIVGLPVQTVLADLNHRGMIGLSQLGIRLAVIRGRVAAAAHETGRVVEDITVVGATKAQGQSVLKDAYTSGLRDFGESYVQELVGRTDIGDGLRYHFIGRIQRNKVARIIQHVARIHTLDSPRVADTVDRLAGENGLSVRCLVQVNIAREESKAGVDPAECAALLNHTRGLEHVTVDGLMALPPRSGFSESRLWFRRLRELRDSLQADGHVLPHLSMGMSDDFDSAVAEGSTFIRVGSALFGPRQTT